jgi:phosphohistidine phosphatase SixA
VAELCPVQVPPMFVTSAMVAVEIDNSTGILLWQQAPHLLKNL